MHTIRISANPCQASKCHKVSSITIFLESPRGAFKTFSITLNSLIAYSWWRHQVEAFFALLVFCAGSSPNFRHKGQWRGALIFSLICAWITGWVNNHGAGDLRHHCAHYDVIVMSIRSLHQDGLYTYGRWNIDIYCVTALNIIFHGGHCDSVFRKFLWQWKIWSRVFDPTPYQSLGTPFTDAD